MPLQKFFFLNMTMDGHPRGMLNVKFYLIFVKPKKKTFIIQFLPGNTLNSRICVNAIILSSILFILLEVLRYLYFHFWKQ